MCFRCTTYCCFILKLERHLGQILHFLTFPLIVGEGANFDSSEYLEKSFTLAKHVLDFLSVDPSQNVTSLTRLASKIEAKFAFF